MGMKILNRQNLEIVKKLNFAVLELFRILDFHISQDFCSSRTKFLKSFEIVWIRKMFGFDD